MDVHFDFDHFHPTFLGADGWSSFGNFGDFFHVHMDDFLARAHEYNLPNDVVHNALESACDFIGIPNMSFEDAPIMAVDTSNPTTLFDDKLLFSREQMMNQGIHDEKSLSLVCTHEVAHRVLQFLHDTNQLSQWQTELACDVFMGVRSVIEDIDIEPIKDSLRGSFDSATHPGFELRNEYIEIGREIGKYFAENDIPVTYENVLISLKEYLGNDAERILNLEQHFHNLATYDINQIQSINAYTKEDVDFFAHHARIAGDESERAAWLEKYNWAVNHLSGYSTVPESIANSPENWIGHHSINAFTKEDVDYYAHQARITSGSEQARWLEKYNWAINHLSGYTAPEGVEGHPEEWFKHHSINAFTKADVDYYAHQVRITTGTEQARWLDRYNWAVNHLSGYTTINENLVNHPEEWLRHSHHLPNPGEFRHPHEREGRVLY